MKILHYSTSSGREPVREFVDELPLESRYEVLTLLRRIENGELLTMPHSRSMSSIENGLHELRVRDSQGIFRVFYYKKIKNLVFLVHALRKKSQTIPDKDRLLILKRIREIKNVYKG
jgi:phage-related protein